MPEKASARSGSQKTIARQQTQNGSEQAPDKGMNTQSSFWKKSMMPLALVWMLLASGA
ncbi:hypothetical protein [Escherichia coli]|uniref:hypothetical protein n=1 Tax=Escherichia coli TaxID=562 RepID=UPI0022285229|nr:hypothetical protein [Escherichia coli]MCW3379385.1 hypothetical protein [Escherichia coli]